MHFKLLLLALVAIFAFTVAQPDTDDSDVTYDGDDFDEEGGLAARGINPISGLPVPVKPHKHHKHKHHKHKHHK